MQKIPPILLFRAVGMGRRPNGGTIQEHFLIKILSDLVSLFSNFPKTLDLNAEVATMKLASNKRSGTG
jgi:hypothetical protein